MKTMAFGANGDTYLSSEIDDPIKHAIMSSQRLFDDYDQEVEPVRTSVEGDSAHFRSLRSPPFWQRIDRADNDPAHNDAVDFIQRNLSANESTLMISMHSIYKREWIMVGERKEKIMGTDPILEILPVSKKLFKISRESVSEKPSG